MGHTLLKKAILHLKMATVRFILNTAVSRWFGCSFSVGTNRRDTLYLILFTTSQLEKQLKKLITLHTEKTQIIFVNRLFVWEKQSQLLHNTTTANGLFRGKSH